MLITTKLLSIVHIIILLMYIIKLSIKPVKTPGNTVPLPERVRCSRVGVGVQQILPGGYPCHALRVIVSGLQPLCVVCG